MLRLALTLLSSLQAGARIKQSFERTLRQAITVAIAVLILIAATCFGLVAAYHVLISSYGFSPAEAAGIMASVLVLLGAALLAWSAFGPRRHASSQATASLGEGIANVEQQIGKAMQQISPMTLLAIAFVAGVILASRKR
jgi:hypothetical protein